MKGFIIVLAVLIGSLYAQPLYAATKKIDRASLLSNKAVIEDVYNKSILTAKNQFEADINASKQLKGKQKAAAVKAAATKRQQLINQAKEVRKKQLKNLSTKK